MHAVISRIRRILAGRFGKSLLVLGLVYGLYLVYVGANYVLVPNGFKDPIYLLTGVRRTDQIVIATVAICFIVMPLLIQHLARDGRPLDFASSPAMKRGTRLLVALLFLNSAAASLRVVLNDLSSEFWAPLYGWVAAVLALQLLIVAVALSRIGRPWVHLGLMTALSGLNFFALYLSLLGAFLTLSDVFRVAVIVLVLLFAALLFAVVGKRIVPVSSVNAVLILTMLGPIAGILFASTQPPADENRIAAFDGIEFHSKPNIHIVSVDALSPATLVQKHMELTDLPYAQMLASDGVLVFKNAFASQVPTEPSLNSLMRLAHIDFAGSSGYFAGRTDGPVTHVLRANGYKISTGFNQQYFGHKGPFVDAYVPDSAQSVNNSTLCALATDNPYKFFSFCALASLFQGSKPAPSWPDRILDIVRQEAGAPGAAPKFTLHYMVNPIGHTALDYRSSDRAALARYAVQYQRGAAAVTEIMARLQATVRNDPTPSILIVMGDHGPFLSRTVSTDENPTFLVQDRYGILAAALVNNTGCTPQQLRHYTKIYATPERILAGVMRCLADDPKRLDAAMKFDEAHDFEKFLYE